MTVPLVLELKKMLSDILVSENVKLRIKGMKDAIELMSELEMNVDKAEKFLVMKDIEKGNKIVDEILAKVNKLEYSSDEELDDIEKEYIDSSEE